VCPDGAKLHRVNPADGATFAAPASITLTARATDPDGTISGAEFFHEQFGLIGQDTTSDADGNYQIVVWNPPQGTHNLSVRATDNDGVYRRAEITITVGPAVPPTPTPTLTPTPARTNVALASAGANILASSVYSASYPASALNDGDRRAMNWEAGGGWNDATPSQHPDWVEVRLAGERTLSEVDVYTIQDEYMSPVEPTAETRFTKYGVTDFTVQYWDGGSWIEITGASVAGNGKVWNRLTFPSVTTDRIRVVVTGAMAGYSRLTEIEAYQ
jgi:peptidyl-Asp metalloendopeptidase